MLYNPIPIIFGVNYEIDYKNIYNYVNLDNG